MSSVAGGTKVFLSGCLGMALAVGTLLAPAQTQTAAPAPQTTPPAAKATQTPPANPSAGQQPPAPPSAGQPAESTK
ncbi:MAG TPA: hypothetical protein VJU82_13345, partial [Acidobacteriaceae bacterium]|nr:hypothetical protein [Acidobacteriaceae bacterium]